MENNEVRCPKCNSNQITAGKKGFSLAKSAGGILLTGGIGALAGLHGSGNVEAICISCGAKWNPVKRYEEEKFNEAVRVKNHEKLWKNNFFKAFENGNMDLANEIIKRERPTLIANSELKDVYDSLKKYESMDEQNGLILKVIGFMLIAFLLYKCS